MDYRKPSKPSRVFFVKMESSCPLRLFLGLLNVIWFLNNFFLNQFSVTTVILKYTLEATTSLSSKKTLNLTLEFRYRKSTSTASIKCRPCTMRLSFKLCLKYDHISLPSFLFFPPKVNTSNNLYDLHPFGKEYKYLVTGIYFIYFEKKQRNYWREI